MGALNSHPAYNYIIECLKKEWDEQARQEGIGRVHAVFGTHLEGIGSENIVDDIILHSEQLHWLLRYLVLVLKTFIKYCITVSLKKC